jgi:lipoyl(octanoyl) transferase
MRTLSDSSFCHLNIPEDTNYFIQSETLFVTKWNWDYEECLTFQKQAQLLVQKQRNLKVYIFCNHPNCFTLGRGNERGQDDLVDFDPAVEARLSLPIHRIHRGGGISFHHTGQWIFYPIMAINESHSLTEHTAWLLGLVKEILKENFRLENVMAANKLLGVWIERKKLASIGIGVSRFVTEHGIALNLLYNDEMFTELKKINPCGMTSQTYTCLDQVKEDISKNIVLEFHNVAIKKLCGEEMNPSPV